MPLHESLLYLMGVAEFNAEELLSIIYVNIHNMLHLKPHIGLELEAHDQKGQLICVRVGAASL